MNRIDLLINLNKRLCSTALPFPDGNYFVHRSMIDELQKLIEAAELENNLQRTAPGCSNLSACKNFQSLPAGGQCPVCPNIKKARL